MANSGKGAEGLDLAARAMAEEYAERLQAENLRAERERVERQRAAPPP
jgi:hypothetical protein